MYALDSLSPHSMSATYRQLSATYRQLMLQYSNVLSLEVTAPNAVHRVYLVVAIPLSGNMQGIH